MRSYILTDRERELIEAFLETKDVPEEDYVNWCQIRHQFRKHEETLTMDLAILEKFMATVRKPKCFGSEDVMIQVDGVYKRKCLECSSEGKCLEENRRRTGIRP